MVHKYIIICIFEIEYIKKFWMFNIHTHSIQKVLSLSRLWYMGIKIDHTFCSKAVKQFKMFFFPF